MYDWTYIDKIMDVWGKKGYMFSLRICTFEGTHEGVLKYATPKWVFDKGAKFTDINGRIEPDYGDEIILSIFPVHAGVRKKVQQRSFD